MSNTDLKAKQQFKNDAINDKEELEDTLIDDCCGWDDIEFEELNGDYTEVEYEEE